MPFYGPWRSDAAIYQSPRVTPLSGTTEVDSHADGGAGALAGSATLALDNSGIAVGLSLAPDGFGDWIYQAFQGFAVLDLDSLLIPTDPTVTYAPQIPFDDPDTSRPDWLGNLPPFDPHLGVQFAGPAGTQALDQPLGISFAGGEIFNHNGDSGTPPDAAAWAVDASVLDLSGGVWTAASVPLNAADAAVAAAPWQHTGILPFFSVPFSTWEYAGFTTTAPRTLLRAARYLTFAFSSVSPAFDPGPASWSGSFAAGLSGAWVPYRNPDYRLIFAGMPPLAHRQRRDGAATSGAPLAHIGTSGNRPRLAWRQNNP